ncbi:MAG: Flp pilus assembly protein CpaB [Acidobacteriota bacterium]|nr:Flp pilus assembly protein CpaB [Acidobacteriota bacterium]
MDRRFLTVLGVSLLFALVISSVFYQMTARSKNTAKADDLKDIVLAARPLGLGVTVKPADVKIGRVPAATFPKGAFSKPEEVVDRPVTSGILVDEPIFEGRLALRGSGSGLAPIIPVGMRAVSVRVNDVVGVAGFVLPGMRVDVLVTGRPPDASGTITATCLQNILVLSAGQTVQADARGQAIQAPTVTLLVSPEQAETLTLASSEGRIQLVLRNGSDQTIEKTPGRDTAQLYGVPPSHKKLVATSDDHPAPRPHVARPRPVAAPAAAAAAPPPPAPPDQIVVIRGTQKTVEVVGPHRGGEGR